MRVLSITAPANGAGKTSLAATLCQSFPDRLDVVKFTTVYTGGDHCPKDAQEQCACRDLEGPFTICEDREVVEREGTDTGRIARASARRVEWAIARPDGYRFLWPELRERLDEDARVVTEGNTGGAFVGADLLVFLYNPWIDRSDWKDNAWRILAGADVVLTNAWHHEEARWRPEGAPRGVLDKVGRVRPDALRVAGDVTRSPETWENGAAFLERVREALDL